MPSARSTVAARWVPRVTQRLRSQLGPRFLLPALASPWREIGAERPALEAISRRKRATAGGALQRRRKIRSAEKLKKGSIWPRGELGVRLDIPFRLAARCTRPYAIWRRCWAQRTNSCLVGFFKPMIARTNRAAPPEGGSHDRCFSNAANRVRLWLRCS
jgi:hypothetical protein